MKKKQDDQLFQFDLFLKPPVIDHQNGILIRGSNRSMSFSNHRHTSSGASSLAHNYSTGSTRVNGKKYN